MADVRPFRALRYAPSIDLAAAICPPFDVISPEQQRALHERSPHNAVRLELAEETGAGRYGNAADALRSWLAEGALVRDDAPCFYLYRQTFERDGKSYSRTIIFARLRLQPWEEGAVLPHEQTFGAPKEDRLKLLRAIRLNTSPVYLLYRDRESHVAPLLDSFAEAGPPDTEFATADGQRHALHRLSDPATVAELTKAFAGETLYVADGHHRYETALAFRDEARATAPKWTGDEPENFALVALTAADDPGLLVLPINRVTNIEMPADEARQRLAQLFELTPADADHAAISIISRGGTAGLHVKDAEAVDRLMPPDRSPGWRRLDYSIANHVVLQYCLGLTPEQMRDYSRLWFTEDAAEAVAEVQGGKATYAVLMRPLPVAQVLDTADAGERMPQKSTFFYPKVPTGLVFNPLDS